MRSDADDGRDLPVSHAIPPSLRDDGEPRFSPSPRGAPEAGGGPPSNLAGTVADVQPADAETGTIPSASYALAPNRRVFTLAWLAPVGALILAGALIYQAMLQRGECILVTFAHGNGISIDDPVNYRGMQVGSVTDVRLGSDLAGVEIEARLRPDAAGLAVEGTQFWIVRPEVSLRGISGLDTLLGPRYLEASPGPTGGPRRTTFQGLDAPPEAAIHMPDGSLEIAGLTPRRGSLKPGSPIYYRGVQVGQVLAIALGPNARRVQVRMAIEPRYAPLVRENSVFWHASGFGADFQVFGGLTLRASSLEAVIAGGLAFATPEKNPGEPAAPGAIFEIAIDPESDWLEWEPEIDWQHAADPSEN